MTNLKRIREEFQSTLPQGERLCMAFGKSVYVEFQSTLPQGERHMIHFQVSIIREFQSTLPQGERRQRSFNLPSSPDFNPRSHKGSDGDLSKDADCREISIHAPTRGATQSPALIRLMERFQSTLPQGERRIDGQGLACPVDFNPRSHKGSDTGTHGDITHGTEFQSTLPQGERRRSTG